MTLDELRSLATIEDNGYHRFQPPYQQMSVTLEEAELLYALVRATRPMRVLELGTGLGLSGRFIAQALNDNQAADSREPDLGALLTVEPIVEVGRRAVVDLLGGLRVSVTETYPFDERWPDLVYIDSGYKERPADIRRWLTNGYAGLVIVHDAERRYPELDLGVGTYLPTANGMWIGHGK